MKVIYGHGPDSTSLKLFEILFDCPKNRTNKEMFYNKEKQVVVRYKHSIQKVCFHPKERKMNLCINELIL